MNQFATPRQVTLLVTDSGLPEKHRKALENEGIRVLVV